MKKQTIILWTEYLETIKMMVDVNEITTLPIYAFDSKRTVCHMKLSDLYDGMFKHFNQDKFDEICHSLDSYIDIKGDIDKNVIIMTNLMLTVFK